MALSPFSNGKKGKGRTRKGCKDLTQSKNGAQARKMLAPLKATYFQWTNSQLELGFVLAEASPTITFVTRDVVQGCQRIVCWGTHNYKYRYETNSVPQ